MVQPAPGENPVWSGMYNQYIPWLIVGFILYKLLK